MKTITDQAAKLSLRPRDGYMRVYENGEEVATIKGGREWFKGRPIIHTFSVVLKDGRILSLPFYSFFRDVKRDMSYLLDCARREAK